MTERLQRIVSYGVSEPSLGRSWWEKLQTLSDEIVIVSDEDELESSLAKADGLILSLGKGASAAQMDRAPGLRYIGMLGTGYGAIDVEAARERQIVVTNIADYSTQGVAEFVFGTVLAELRELERAREQAGRGDYDEGSFVGRQLSDSTFGVIGLGNIGKRVAEIAERGFGADVLCWSRASKPLAGSSRSLSTPEDVLGESDIVSLHLEFNPETERFLGKERLALIRDGAIVINTAPMELVDLDALEHELRQERLTFILDHSDEMAADAVARLSALPGCVVYPPIAYTTREASAAKKEIFVTNLQSFLDGGAQNVVS